MARAAEPRPRRVTGDPYGLAAARPFLAPILSLAGLALVGLVSLGLVTGSIGLPIFPSKTTGNGGGGGGGSQGTPPPNRTPSPSAPVVVNPTIQIHGTLVYVKAGNLWIQTGNTTRQLTNTGRDSQPTWSPDGQWIYFIETRETRGYYPISGGVMTNVDLKYPILSRIHPDGSGRGIIQSGLYRTGPGRRYTWYYFILQPAVAPNGRQVAVVSDGPDPTRSDVILQLYDVSTKKMTSLNRTEYPPLGHQDPAWSPDGSKLLYVANQKDGPVIYRYAVATKKSSPLTATGYMEPAYSPDGRYVAAVLTNALGTDVVVLDANTGAEVCRVTTDGRSWGPTWSPDGTQLVYLHLSGLANDLKLATLARAANGDISVTRTEDLTEFAGLDGNSRPAWLGAPAQSPTPGPSASPAASPTPANSPSPS